jgi:hypothetical protein
MATVATRREKTLLCEKEQNYYEPRIPLTLTGLLMEGHSAQISILSIRFKCPGSELIDLDSGARYSN